MMPLKSVILTVVLTTVCSQAVHAQLVFEQGIVRGGITAAGFSTGQGAGSGSFDIHIEPGSVLKKAYALSYSALHPPSPEFLLNGNSITFDPASAIMNVDVPNHNAANPIKLYFQEITENLDAETTNHNITIPLQPGLLLNEGFWTLFIIVVYEHEDLLNTAYTICINGQDFAGNEEYSIEQMHPVNTGFPVGFSLYTDRTGSGFTETNEVYFNSNFLGVVGGSDNVNWQWNGAGVKGHFYYQNNQLFGLDDDVPNNTMSGTDGLADVSGYLENNATSCTFRLQHINYPFQNPAATNINLAYTFAYTTPCQPFETTLTDDVELCRGDTAQLFATGGTSTGSAPAYEWLPQEDLSCYNCPNPVFSGDSSKVYTVRIWNTDSCSKVLPVKVKVLDAPNNINLSTSPATCSENNGVLQIGGVSGGKPPYSYNFAGNWITNPTAPIFSQFSAGEYTLTVRDQNQCFYSQPFTIEEVIPAIAAFSANPQEGTEPLTVQFNNQSSGATDYAWTVEGETFTTFQHQHTFDSAGSYPVQLISWYNEPHCADTATATIIVHPDYTHSLFLPTLYDNPGVAYTIQTTNVAHIRYELFNTIGQRLYHVEQEVNNGPTELWYGGSYATGYYFFRIRYTNIEGQQFEERGKVLVVR